MENLILERIVLAVSIILLYLVLENLRCQKVKTANWKWRGIVEYNRYGRTYQIGKYIFQWRKKL